MPTISPLEIVGILLIFAFWLAVALGFLVIAARLVTRVVPDQIAKDRERRPRP